jgi:hypothetical protein
MPSQNWFRPIVTQQPTVGVQGSAGAAGDEKSELVSQKMTLTKVTGTAVTYGGYVNVSRQDIDFSSPQIMDIIIEGLANAYALQTETATATALDASASTNVGYGASPTAVTLTAALWSAAATIYAAVKGAPGRLSSPSPPIGSPRSVRCSRRTTCRTASPPVCSPGTSVPAIRATWPAYSS